WLGAPLLQALRSPSDTRESSLVCHRDRQPLRRRPYVAGGGKRVAQRPPPLRTARTAPIPASARQRSLASEPADTKANSPHTSLLPVNGHTSRRTYPACRPRALAL